METKTSPSRSAAAMLAVGFAALTPGLALADFSIENGNNKITFSGFMNIQAEDVQADNPTVPGNTPASRGRINENGSELRFSFERKFNSDLTAFGTIGSEIQSYAGGVGDNTSTLGIRNTGVGLRTAYGELALGRWDIHYQYGAFLVDSAYADGPVAWSSGALMQYANTQEIVGQRFGNTVRYVSPKVNGFTGYAYLSRNDGALNRVPASGINAAQDMSYSAALTYDTAGLRGFVSLFDRNNAISTLPFAAAATSALMSQKSARGGISYNTPIGLVVGLMADWTQQGYRVPGGASTFAGTRKFSRVAYSIPLRYPFGPHELSATYAHSGSVDGDVFDHSAIGTNSETGASYYHLGYKYRIDKDTNLQIGYARVANQTNGAYDIYANGALNSDVRGVLATRGVTTQSFQIGMFYRY